VKSTRRFRPIFVAFLEILNCNYVPPSSVITTTLVSGPRPAGLMTRSETRYCVKLVRSWMVNCVTSGSLMVTRVVLSEVLSFLGR
jgi:hypothetical protein